MNPEDKFYIPACQKTQINIHLKESAFMSFTEWVPEDSDGLIANLVFKTVFNITTGRTTFAADTRAEAITVLHPECRKGCLNVTSGIVLRKGEEGRAWISCS